MASSSRSWKYDVFPSFSGKDVRSSFLSHLYKELDRNAIKAFKDQGIERSHIIKDELVTAIGESMISVVIFSENYASSTWCLDELVEILKCFNELNQKVFPVFYKIDPSHVRKQEGNFGKVFEGTCKGKPEDHKKRWIHALRDVANIAGEDLQIWSDEATLIETITNKISNMLFKSSGFVDFGDFVGVEAHLERLTSMLCLESKEVRMVGIVGSSGIGKSTIGDFLSSKLSSQFHHHALMTYDRPSQHDHRTRKILDQNSIVVENFGEVEKRLKHRKVLIVLDDVGHQEFLQTLVGKTEWFGLGSRIIVITQDRGILKGHGIEHIYEVELPSDDLALEMLCRSAFGKDSPPDGFMELAVKVVKLAGNLPLALRLLGCDPLKGKDKDEWIEIIAELQHALPGDIKNTLNVCYERLDRKYQNLFIYIACFFKGKTVSYIEDLLGDIGHIDIGLKDIGLGLKVLARKSLIRITTNYSNDRGEELETVEMHDLLQKLGIEIDRKLVSDPGRRFLTNGEDTVQALTDLTKRKNLLGIFFKDVETKYDFEPLMFLDEKSFERMPNLQFLDVDHSSWWDAGFPLDEPSFLKWDKRKFPPNLRLLKWDNCRATCLPSHFNTQFLVELSMRGSNLKKLWKGTQQLGCLKKMDMRFCMKLKKLPDLSNARNLEKLLLSWCTSLLTLPFSFQNINKLRWLDMGFCTKLENFPTHLNMESIEFLNIIGCGMIKNFPSFRMHITTSLPHDNKRFFYLQYRIFPSSMPSSSFSWRCFTREIIRKPVHIFKDDKIEKTSSMPSSSFIWRYDAFASFIGEMIRKLLRSQLDRKSVHTFKDDDIEITSSMPSSSSSISRRYDVFPSFASEDVCKSYLSHIVEELDRKSINTFKDSGIERSLPIGPALLSAIRESRISIVIFSENYASSTRCLDELVEIHKCFKDQIVIPVFNNIDPHYVQEQTGDFGKVFEETCKGKPEDRKQRWIHALTDIAKMAGEEVLLSVVLSLGDY